ncbi:MAG: ferric reductase-like transmembrane domain-containing protein [Patescibacteria group bacterium]
MNKINNKLKSLSVLVPMLLVFGLIYFGLNLGSKFFTVSAATSTSFQKDSDYDGLSDQVEINVYHTNPLKTDTDGDSYLDSAEVLAGSNPLDAKDPASKLTANSLVKPVISSTPWYIARASGLVAYVLMFLVVILGIGMTTAYIYKYINPVKAWVIHKYLSLVLGVALITHLTGLFFDKFINFNLKDILIPFVSDFKPIFLNFGIFAFYVLLIIIFTSLWFRLKYKRVWRGVHYFVYLLFIFSLIHGFFIGSDSNTVLAAAVYLVTGLIFFGLMGYRLVTYFKR